MLEEQLLRRVDFLERALLEYVERFGLTDLARAALSRQEPALSPPPSDIDDVARLSLFDCRNHIGQSRAEFGRLLGMEGDDISNALLVWRMEQGRRPVPEAMLAAAREAAAGEG